MKGYALFQKGNDRPIRIALENDQGNIVDALVFATKGALKASTDIEDDEEIKTVCIS